MKRKKNIRIRILCVSTFLEICGFVMFATCPLSARSEQMLSTRNEIVTEEIREQVNTGLEATEEGITSNGRIKCFVALHSPCGSDWSVNIKKLTHFSIYSTLAAGTYITLAILGVNRSWRFLLTVGICFCFALGGRHHQKFTDCIPPMSNMYLDTSGALVSICIWMMISIIYSGMHLLANKTYGGT